MPRQRYNQRQNQNSPKEQHQPEWGNRAYPFHNLKPLLAVLSFRFPLSHSIREAGYFAFGVTAALGY